MIGGGLRALAAARRVRDDVAAVDAVAGVAERLAVLMSAGVPASAAWRHLAADALADPVLGAAALAAEEGEPIAPALAAAIAESAEALTGRGRRRVRAMRALRAAGNAAAVGTTEAAGGTGAMRTGRDVIGGRTTEALGTSVVGGGAAPERDAVRASAWAAVAAAWAVASETGAPLAASLRDLAASLRDDAQLRREVRAALAGPKASAKLVTLLPVVAVVFGVVLGFDTARVLLGNPLGWVCVVIGSALLWAGARWNRALAARAAPPSASPGLELDLLAIAMSSGTSVDGALSITRRAVGTHLPGADDSDRHATDRDIAATVRIATQAGAPVAELLRAEAHRHRRAARAEGAVRAAALSVRLMIPLGVCILPAFVLLGVAPLMISVVTGTLGGVA
ncbi:type II secretion system F family protein [Agromyces aerolatus]|uniref:type II secretion system F family protein n=1 Tax=Agromyces sp. LY-1074 TaxID=3074080 RepID=UPI00285FCC2C|nr:MULTISPECIES: type II secretion system F family protein [unclassified Agromyces]MDR5700258.1 type II secretion system F family protein [Agromyces sp. LY-1074]MDR5706764.1 type II secretion system F family protein [Agromyces sp. LY-1358]